MKVMNKLTFCQKLELRDRICEINIEDLSDEDNWRLQGENLFKLGFNAIDAKYPSDTYVGTHRFNGWKCAFLCKSRELQDQ